MKTSLTNIVTENLVANNNMEDLLSFDRKLNTARGRDFLTSVKNSTAKMLEEVKKLNDPELLALMTGTLACYES
ncbi:MAG: hypothetical protein J6C85_01425 [Alphaproteobacteria bacterium]|nr:hypothetical protein [Alphaproteobacteria bacterium]